MGRAEVETSVPDRQRYESCGDGLGCPERGTPEGQAPDEKGQCRTRCSCDENPKKRFHLKPAVCQGQDREAAREDAYR